jgi:hypothetical protein
MEVTLYYIVLPVYKVCDVQAGYFQGNQNHIVVEVEAALLLPQQMLQGYSRFQEENDQDFLHWKGLSKVNFQH